MLISRFKRKIKILFKTDSLIGYVQLYFKIVGKNEIYYARFDGNFSKPLTRFRLNSMKRSMREYYERFDTICSVEFCTKTEYEKIHCDQEISYSWGDYDG